jgi:hypothetical protein
MKGRLAISLFLAVAALFLSCAYERSTASLLKHKTLLYYSGDTVFRQLSLIIEKRGDSIFKGNVRSSSLEEWFYLKESGDNTSHLHLSFQLPYILKLEGKKVILSFNAYPAGAKQRTYHKIQYLLDKEDSVECTDLTYLCNQEYGYSKYLGDTTMVFSGKDLKCHMFREYYPRSRGTGPSQDYTITRWFEKKSWIPILVDDNFYESPGFKMPMHGEYAHYSILHAVIPPDSLKKLDPKTRYCHY